VNAELTQLKEISQSYV